jgi:hypothetical protein
MAQFNLAARALPPLGPPLDAVACIVARGHVGHAPVQGTGAKHGQAILACYESYFTD